MMTTKTILEIRRNIAPHWVGDGFPVRSLYRSGKMGYLG
jgi:hypothetical protein